jgi:hypothetical protein
MRFVAERVRSVREAKIIRKIAGAQIEGGEKRRELELRREELKEIKRRKEDELRGLKREIL